MIVLLGLVDHPVFSTMLLLVAGILVGYAVCYPFRADTSVVTEQLQQVQEQNVSLQAALDEQRSSYARLEKKYMEQQQEWIELRESHNELTTAWERFGTENGPADLERQSIQQLASETAEAVRYERAERRVVEQALIQAEDTIDELRQQVSLHEARKDDGAKLQIRLDEAHQYVDTWKQQLAAQTSEYAAELARIRAQNSELSMQLQDCQRQCSQLDEAFSSQGRELALAQNECLKLRSVELERTQLAGAIGARRDQVRKLEAERDEARAAEHQIRQQLEQIKSAANSREEDDEQWREQREKMESKLDASVEEINALRQRCLILQNAAEERDVVQTALEDGRRRLQQLAIERDAAFDAEFAAKEALAALEATRQRDSRDVDNLREQREEILAEFESAQSDRERLARALKHREQKIATLQATCDKLSAREDDRDALAEQLSNQAECLRKISLEHELTAASLGQAEQTIEDLRQQLESREQTNDDPRRERNEADSIAVPGAKRDPAANTRIDPRLGLVYVRPPEFKDDLKQISGVAEVLEKKLNDFGIFTYKQIMEWDDSAVEAFSDLLTFKDRISREDWIGQARRLDAQAHGRAA